LSYVDPKCVTRFPRTETALRRDIFEALGNASACWENPAGAGVFDSTRAAQIGEELVAAIIARTRLGEPSLGCATNRELLAEIEARHSVGHVEPDYRTVVV